MLFFFKILFLRVKRKEIFSSLRDNKVTLVSGRVGEGRSTCLPQLCLQYLRATNDSSSVLVISSCRASSDWLSGRLSKELGVEDDAIIQDGRLHMSSNVDEIIALDHNTPKVCVIGANDALRLLASRPLLDNYAFIILDDIDKRRVAQDFMMVLTKCHLSRDSHLKFVLNVSTSKSNSEGVEIAKEMQSFLETESFLHINIPKMKQHTFDL